MAAEQWHELLLFSMGTAATRDVDDWPKRGLKRAWHDGFPGTSPSFPETDKIVFTNANSYLCPDPI